MAVFKNKLLAQRNIGEKNGLLDITAGMLDGVGNQTLYMTYQTSAEAKTAFNKLNNLKFDGNHRMNCVGINDLRAIIDEEEQQVGGDFKAPEMSLSKQKKEHNMDEQLRSQFVLREDKLLYLQWLDHLDKSALTAISSEFMNLECQVNKMVFPPPRQLPGCLLRRWSQDIRGS